MELVSNSLKACVYVKGNADLILKVHMTIQQADFGGSVWVGMETIFCLAAAVEVEASSFFLTCFVDWDGLVEFPQGASEFFLSLCFVWV